MENEEKKEIEINEQNPEQVPESEAAEEKTVDAGENLATEGESESIKAEEPTVSSEESKEDAPAASGEGIEPSPESEPVKAEDSAKSDKDLILKSPSTAPEEDSAVSGEESKEDTPASADEEIEPEPEPESHILIGPGGEIFDINSE